MIKGKIMLVDDDEDDQFIFRDALKDIGFNYECIPAKNGPEAISILEKEKEIPGMIFLDLNMPVMNGSEFLTAIKEHPVYKSIPVSIYSTSNNPADKAYLQKLGAKQFITKASDFNKLKDILNEILIGS